MYYSNLQKANQELDTLHSLSDEEFNALPDSQKQKAFCRTDGNILLNNRIEREAIKKCIKFKTKYHCHGSGNCHGGHDQQLAEESCADSGYSAGQNFTDFLPSGYTPSTIEIACQEDIPDTNRAIADPTG